MSLSKENLLNLITSSIITLRDKKEELLTNPKLKEVWRKESKTIHEETAKLSPEDLYWLNQEYQKWSEKNMTKEVNSFIFNALPETQTETQPDSNPSENS